MLWKSYIEKLLSKIENYFFWHIFNVVERDQTFALLISYAVRLYSTYQNLSLLLITKNNYLPRLFFSQRNLRRHDKHERRRRCRRPAPRRRPRLSYLHRRRQQHQRVLREQQQQQRAGLFGPGTAAAAAHPAGRGGETAAAAADVECEQRWGNHGLVRGWAACMVSEKLCASVCFIFTYKKRSFFFFLRYPWKIERRLLSFKFVKLL